jgi:hypothetical protein
MGIRYRKCNDPGIMRFSALLFFCCLLPTAIHADHRQLTADGTWWNGLSHLDKLGFIEGYVIGYSAGNGDLQRAIKVAHTVSLSDSANPSANEDNPAGLTFGSLTNGVDNCYSDLRNTAVDVRFCLDWTVRGLKGESKEAREDYLIRIRRQSRKAIEANVGHEF